jgi:hypothetical protein
LNPDTSTYCMENLDWRGILYEQDSKEGCKAQDSVKLVREFPQYVRGISFHE